MATIHFKARLFKLRYWTIIRLTQNASAKLPSRGQTMVTGTVNGIRFKTPLEPDGKGGHWFKVDTDLQNTAKVHAGSIATLVIEPTKEWPEPKVPADLQTALEADNQASELWKRTTPMARWEWIRWIRATAQTETRKRRIEVACSKLKSGERRPCCWNRNLCTEPTVSKNGVLLDQLQATKI
ncbi:MAG: YdeI/OmpD-associated family protein [Candidatus Saccharimonadales bacterium]